MRFHKGFTLISKGAGFTLIELMVTVSIIAILMSIAVSTYLSFQTNARDARRKSDLATLQSVLEQYHADQLFYPYCVNGDPPNDTGCRINTVLQLTSSTDNPFPPETERVYSNRLPLDPINQRINILKFYEYYFKSYPDNCDNTSGNYCTRYCIFAKMENTANAGTAGTCVWSPMFNYSVVSP